MNINGDVSRKMLDLIERIISTFKVLFESEYILLMFDKKIDNLDLFYYNIINRTDGSMDLVDIYHPVIKILTNKDEPVETVAFAFAHELSHVFLSAKDKSHSLDFCSSNCTHAINVVLRKNHTRDIVFGNALEEVLCNYISFKICETIAAESSLEMSRLSKFKNQIDFIDTLVSNFSNTIIKSDKLDGLVLIDDQGIYQPYNLFWFNLTNYNMSQNIFSYENIMGRDSWEYLDTLISEAFIHNKKNYIQKLKTEMKRLKMRLS